MNSLELKELIRYNKVELLKDLQSRVDLDSYTFRKWHKNTKGHMRCLALIDEMIQTLETQQKLNQN